MKKLFFFSLLLLSLQSTYCQYNSSVYIKNSNRKLNMRVGAFNVQTLDIDSNSKKSSNIIYNKDYYNMKAKQSNKTAFILLGSGVAIMSSTLFIHNDKPASYGLPSSSDLLKFGIVVLGAIPISISPFYFRKAKSNSNKAKQAILP